MKEKGTINLFQTPFQFCPCYSLYYYNILRQWIGFQATMLTFGIKIYIFNLCMSYILYRAIYIYSATHTHTHIDIYLCLYGDELIWLLKFVLLVLYLDSLSHNTEWIPLDKIAITFGETVHNSGIRRRSLLR